MSSLSNTADNWEEITDLDFEDTDLTIHSVPTPRSNALLDIDNSSDSSDSEEYQLIEAHTMPTYAAAAKWGNKARAEGNLKETRVCEKGINDNGIKQKGMRLKNNIIPSSPPSSDDMDSLNRMKTSDARSCKERDNKSTSQINKNIRPLSQTHPSPPASAPSSPPPSSSTIIPLLDTEIPTKSSSRKLKNRHNTRKAKIATKKLQSQLVSPNETEFYEHYSRGDTNRDPEFVKYKICKKAMKYEKKAKRSDGKRAKGDICEL